MKNKQEQNAINRIINQLNKLLPQEEASQPDVLLDLIKSIKDDKSADRFGWNLREKTGIKNFPELQEYISNHNNPEAVLDAFNQISAEWKWIIEDFYRLDDYKIITESIEQILENRKVVKSEEEKQELSGCTEEFDYQPVVQPVNSSKNIFRMFEVSPPPSQNTLSNIINHPFITSKL